MGGRVITCTDGRVKNCADGRVLICGTVPCECPPGLTGPYDVIACGVTIEVTEQDNCLWGTLPIDPPLANTCKAEGIVAATMALLTAPPCRWRLVIDFVDETLCTYEKNTGSDPTGEYSLVSGDGCAATATVEETVP